MKRVLCALLVLCLVLCGCGLSGQRLREPVTFYYLRAQYRYGTDDGVIAGEQRESSGHSQDLTYLLGMYLTGPAGEDLVSPLPLSTKLLEAVEEETSVTVRLSDLTLSESEFSLACACLTLTVTQLTGSETVTVESGERSVTMSSQNLTIFDDGTTAATTEETQ